MTNLGKAHMLQFQVYMQNEPAFPVEQTIPNRAKSAHCSPTTDVNKEIES